MYIDKNLCTCRAWKLTGIPCSYTIRALGYLKVDHVSYISEWYHKSKYKAAYEYLLQPVGCNKFMKCDEFQPIEPPPMTKLAGRPR